MDAILDKLTEIENAASAIVRHAEEQKDVLGQEFDEKRKKFDEDLENKTKARLEKIREQLEKEQSRVPRKLDFGFRKRPSDTDRDRNGKRTLLIKYGKNLS